MTAMRLLEDCRAKGIEIYLVNGSLKIRGDIELVRQLTPELRKRKAELLQYFEAEAANDTVHALLQRIEAFGFDDSHGMAETTRVNNMAWEFMQVDGMPFSEAIRTASDIVSHCHAAVCEAAYDDVRTLWERLKTRRP